MKKKANHQIPGMNAAKAQGKGAGYRSSFTEEMAEPLTEMERQNNKKTKKRQS